MKDKFKVPSVEIDLRIKRIQRELQDNGVDGLFIVQRVDLFYFSGTAQTGFLYIPAEGQPVLFIKRYLPRAREESSIKNIIEVKSIKEVPSLIVDFYGKLPGTLGFEFDVLPVGDFNFYKRLFNVEKEGEDLSWMRWTVDTEKDLQFVKRIFDELYTTKEIFHMENIVSLLKIKPEILKINKTISRNEGYQLSLLEDGKVVGD